MSTIDSSNPAWPLYHCNVMGAWSASMGAGIAVVHPDTGWTTHPELTRGQRYLRDQKLSRSFREGEEDGTAEDPLVPALLTRHPGHGTTTAGSMIGGFGSPADGTDNDAPPLLPDYDELVDAPYASGSGPLVHVLPQRVTDSVVVGGRDLAALIEAVYFAQGVDDPDGVWQAGVVSISLGRLSYAFALEQALYHARLAGIVVCAAAGQGSRLPLGPVWPGRSVHTICVAACDNTDTMLARGFYGPEVDITAAGVNVAVPLPRRSWGETAFEYDRTDGSSHATAMVATACALWQAHHGREALIQFYGGPEFLLDAFRLTLRRSCRIPDEWDQDEHGHGVLDVAALLAEDLPAAADVQDLADEIGWYDEESWD